MLRKFRFQLKLKLKIVKHTDLVVQVDFGAHIQHFYPFFKTTTRFTTLGILSNEDGNANDDDSEKYISGYVFISLRGLLGFCFVRVKLC